MRIFANKAVLGLALVILAVTISTGYSQVVAEPGSMIINTNLKYLNNIFGLVFPITMQQMLQKQTFDLDFEDSGFAYSIKIKDIYVNSIAFDKKEIGFIPGTNTARLTISGFDISTRVDGAIYALWFIPLKTAALNVTNLTLQIDLEAPSSDNVNWQVKDAIFLDI